MTSQLALDYTRQPITRVDEVRSGWSHKDSSPTEAAAARRVVKLSGKRRLQVMRIVASSRGITRQEIADRYGLPIQSVCGRVAELIEGGFVYEDGVRDHRAILHPTARGMAA